MERPRVSIKRNMLILGVGQLASDVFGSIMARSYGGYNVVGFVSGGSEVLGKEIAARMIKGTYDQLEEVVNRERVYTIVVCLEDRRASLPMQALLDCKAMGINVVDGHDLYEQSTGRLSIDLLRPSSLIFSTGFRRRRSTMLFKRAMDIVLAASSALAVAPVLLLVAILIKVDSPGPVLYRQLRVGLRGQPFTIWKFRSMCQDAEKNGPRWAEKEDPRVSRVGRILRKFRLDELPQLYNVLKGEMSLVGPRPERPIFVDQLRKNIPYYDLRHTVRPGVTGWAQTQFRYGATADDAHMKLQYDLYYVKNMSPRIDVQVLVETIRVVLFGEGAR